MARSVHTLISDPDDDTSNRRLFGTPKNNLGRADLPTLSFVPSTEMLIKSAIATNGSSAIRTSASLWESSFGSSRLISGSKISNRVYLVRHFPHP